MVRYGNADGWLPRVPTAKERSASELLTGSECHLELFPEKSFLFALVGGILVAALLNFFFLSPFLFFGVTFQEEPGGFVIFATFGAFGVFYALLVLYGAIVGLFPRSRVFANKQTIYPGETFIVGWNVLGGFNPTSVIGLRLTSAIAMKGIGEKLEATDIPIVEFEKRKETQSGETEVRLPEDALPSFESPSERVRWAITMKYTHFNSRPCDIKFPILVVPEDLLEKERVTS